MDGRVDEWMDDERDETSGDDKDASVEERSD
jgi:hypothetical protein